MSIRVQGSRAFFRRPEFWRDEITYDIITPASARGIFDAIHWRPAIRWDIRRIHIMNEIMFETHASNESRRVLLRDVAYVIEAHMVITDRAGPRDEPERHKGMFRRQLRLGASINLGDPSYPGTASLCSDTEPWTVPPISRDLGWMFHSQDFAGGQGMRFFRANLVRGTLSVPPLDDPDLIFG